MVAAVIAPVGKGGSQLGVSSIRSKLWVAPAYDTYLGAHQRLGKLATDRRKLLPERPLCSDRDPERREHPRVDRLPPRQYDNDIRRD